MFKWFDKFCIHKWFVENTFKFESTQTMAKVIRCEKCGQRRVIRLKKGERLNDKPTSKGCKGRKRAFQ